MSIGVGVRKQYRNWQHFKVKQFLELVPKVLSKIASAGTQKRYLILAPRFHNFVPLRLFPVMYIPKYISAPNITYKIKNFRDFARYNSENQNGKINKFDYYLYHATNIVAIHMSAK